MFYSFVGIKSGPISERNYSLIRYDMLIAASRGSICVVGRHYSPSLRIATTRANNKLQAVHWRAALSLSLLSWQGEHPRALSAIETAIETV